MQPVILVSFFRDACPHCRNFKPVLDALAQQGVQILPVDASRDRATAQQWGVQGVPCTFICRPEGQGLRVLGKIEGSASPDATVAVVRSAAADEVGQVKAAPGAANAAPAQTAAGYPMMVPGLPMHQQPQVFTSQPPGPGFNGLPSGTPHPQQAQPQIHTPPGLVAGWGSPGAQPRRPFGQ